MKFSARILQQSIVEFLVLFLYYLYLDRHIVYVIVSHAKYQICRGIDKIFSCIIHDDNDRPRFEIKIHMNDDAQLINARLCLKTTGLVNLRENKIPVYV